jgi:hypothetical protein
MPNSPFENEVPAEFRRLLPDLKNHNPVVEKIGVHWCTRPRGGKRNKGKKICLDTRCDAHGTRATMLRLKECPHKQEVAIRLRPGRSALRTQTTGMSHALGRM